MYIGVDVGGTKTLVAVLDNHGVITEHKKFPTDKKYEHWLLELKHTLANFKSKDYQAGGAGITAVSFDRELGRAHNFGNLPWRNVSIQADLERVADCPIVVENDCKMAVLSESMLLKDMYKRVLYVTVSTGIGYGFAVDNQIDTSIGDGGGRTILLEHKGKIMPWEDFASGRAIVKRFGKKAEEITDETSWRQISRDLAKGFIHLIAIMQPEVIVIGGGVGVYFDRYAKLLAADLKKYEMPLVKLPDLMKAQRPEEAVVYGCYDIAKQVYGHATADH